MQRRRRLPLTPDLVGHTTDPTLRRPVPAVAAALFLLLPAPALAGSITLEVDTACSPGVAGIECTVSVRNRGGEPAWSPTIRIDALGSTQEAPVGESLAADALASRTFLLATHGVTPGTHPVGIRVSFTDANGYRLSAVAARLVEIGEPPPPGLVGTLAPLRLEETGRLELALRNDGEHPLEPTVRWWVPDEIEVQAAGGAPRRLVPGEVGRWRATATDRAALPGSTYPVFALVDAEAAGGHAGAVIGGTLTIADGGGRIARRWWLIVPLTGLFLIYLFAQLGGRRVRRAAR